MNRVVAYKLLANELAAYKSKPLNDLLAIVGTTKNKSVRDGGMDYDVSTMFQSLDSGVRVRVAIREANWGAPYDVLDDEIIRKPDAHS